MSAPLLAIIVPVLEEEQALAGVLDHLPVRPEVEVIVVDGGSRDDTLAIARRHPLRPRVLVGPGGRARQLNLAAEVTRAPLLCFLHADSRLPRAADHGRLRLRAANGAARAHGMPSRAGDDLVPPVADPRRTADGAVVARDPLAVDRRRPG